VRHNFRSLPWGISFKKKRSIYISQSTDVKTDPEYGATLDDFTR